jgi:hypothetical protein
MDGLKYHNEFKRKQRRQVGAAIRAVKKQAKEDATQRAEASDS